MITITLNINWNALLPQFEECLSDIKSFGYTSQEIDTVLNDPYNWTESCMFKREKFNFENAEFTLTELCNVVEMLTGSDTKFADELRWKFKGLLMGVAA